MRRIARTVFLSSLLIANGISSGLVPAAVIGDGNIILQQPSGTAAKQLDPMVEKIRNKITAIGVGGAVTIYLKNGDELHGTVSHINSDTVELAEVDRRIAITVDYHEVKKIREGLGNVNVFTGRRVTRSHTARVIGLVIASAVIAIPLIIVATSKD